MINLNKLKEIDNSILNNVEEKDVLLKYYSTALRQLDTIEEQFSKCLELVVNIDETTELLSKIARKTNKEFLASTLLKSTGNLIKFIQIRRELITKAYNLVQKNNSMEDFVQNYPEILMFNHNECNVSILTADINELQAVMFESNYNLQSAQNKEDLSKLGYLFFGNSNFKLTLSEITTKRDKDYNNLLKEVSKTYHTFITDFNDTLKTLYKELEKASTLLKDYIETSRKIYTTYDKYKN